MRGKRPTPSAEITRWLIAWREGRPEAPGELFPLVYEELRKLARGQLRRHPAGETLRPTALVHEAYLKLIDRTRVRVNDREHFFALAARAMRQILVDHARRRSAAKRGGGAMHTVLSEEDSPVELQAVELLSLDDALTGLESLEPRLAKVVELRFFGGLSVEEVAAALDISPRTVKRDWRKARAFLYTAIAGHGPGPSPSTGGVG